MRLLALTLAFSLGQAETCDGACQAAQGKALLQSNLQQRVISTDMSSEAIAHRAKSRARLLIESDFRTLHSSSIRAYHADEDLVTNINNTWTHFVATTNITAELTAEELELFRERFVDGMELLAKHNGTDPSDWMREVAEALNDEKPALSQAFVDVINGANLGFSISIQDWMANQSYSDMSRKSGLMPETEDESLLQEHREALSKRYGHLLDRTPDTFNSATNWPDCADVVTRVHNQGTCGSCWAFGHCLRSTAVCALRPKGHFKANSAVDMQLLAQEPTAVVVE